jgi:2-keto-4-pentenoate hydratase/2-oxohepta-3-ene-1,7-dioic acid hydratase in catechol pathway
MLDFLRAGEPAMQAAREVCAYMAKRPAVPVGERLTYAFEEVKVLAPIPRPGKILCSGINYRSHKEENPNATMPTEAVFFFQAAVVRYCARRSDHQARANEPTRLRSGVCGRDRSRDETDC